MTIVAYRIIRPDAGKQWVHAGTTVDEAIACLRDELDSNEVLSAEECGTIVIEAYETTQTEIDNLKEFEGW